MKKTTLYIEDELVRDLKRKAMLETGSSMTAIINEAIREYLSGETTKDKNRFPNLKKARGGSRALKKAGDPVEYQRKIRAEWD
jgi:hypothetical protein